MTIIAEIYGDYGKIRGDADCGDFIAEICGDYKKYRGDLRRRDESAQKSVQRKFEILAREIP